MWPSCRILEFSVGLLGRLCILFCIAYFGSQIFSGFFLIYLFCFLVYVYFLCPWFWAANPHSMNAKGTASQYGCYKGWGWTALQEYGGLKRGETLESRLQDNIQKLRSKVPPLVVRQFGDCGELERDKWVWRHFRNSIYLIFPSAQQGNWGNTPLE